MISALPKLQTFKEMSMCLQYFLFQAYRDAIDIGMQLTLISSGTWSDVA